jgi:caffeoyl-CoA O-methyltransferase
MPEITDPRVEQYATEHSSQEPPYLAALAQETRERFAPVQQMMVGRLEGRFLKMLVAAAQPRRVLEIGTFTGYSALSMAEALPADGRIITCELDAERAAFARRGFEAAGFADRIEVRVGRAIDTVAGLEGPFDFCFIDADKPSYPDYYEECMRLLRPRGLLMIDNVFYGGLVAESEPGDANLESLDAIKQTNERVAADERVLSVMLGIADGVTLAVKLEDRP